MTVEAIPRSTTIDGKEIRAKDWEKYFGDFLADHVIAGCTIRGSGGRNVEISTGRARIGGIYIEITAAETVEITASSEEHLYIQMSRDTGGEVQSASIVKRTGSGTVTDALYLGSAEADATSIIDTTNSAPTQVFKDVALTTSWDLSDHQGPLDARYALKNMVPPSYDAHNDGRYLELTIWDPHLVVFNNLVSSLPTTYARQDTVPQAYTDAINQAIMDSGGGGGGEGLPANLSAYYTELSGKYLSVTETVQNRNTPESIEATDVYVRLTGSGDITTIPNPTNGRILYLYGSRTVKQAQITGGTTPNNSIFLAGFGDRKLDPNHPLVLRGSSSNRWHEVSGLYARGDLRYWDIPYSSFGNIATLDFQTPARLRVTASDAQTISTIVAGATGVLITLVAAAENRITIAHENGDDGNISLVDGRNRVLSTKVPLVLCYNGTNWIEVSGPYARDDHTHTGYASSTGNPPASYTTFYNSQYPTISTLNNNFYTRTHIDDTFATKATVPAAYAAAVHASRHAASGADELTGNLNATARINLKVGDNDAVARRDLYLVASGSASLTQVDDSTNDRLTVTIGATGGSGGEGLPANLSSYYTELNTIYSRLDTVPAGYTTAYDAKYFPKMWGFVDLAATVNSSGQSTTIEESHQFVRITGSTASNIDKIGNPTAGRILYLISQNSNAITIRHNEGSGSNRIYLKNSRDRVLEPRTPLVLIGLGSTWREVFGPYAREDVVPPAYAAVSHTHDIYALKTDVPPAYASSQALTDGLAGKSDSDHTHDIYALKTTVPPAYAAVNHTHDTYALNTAVYTRTHIDDTFATKTTVPPAYAAVNHTHDIYALKTTVPPAYSAAVHASRHAASGADELTGNLNATARTAVSFGDDLVGTRRGLRFVQGANVSLTVSDDPDNERVDVTIAGDAGSGGLPSDLSSYYTELNGIYARQDAVPSGYAAAVHASRHAVGGADPLTGYMVNSWTFTPKVHTAITATDMFVRLTDAANTVVNAIANPTAGRLLFLQRQNAGVTLKQAGSETTSGRFFLKDSSNRVLDRRTPTVLLGTGNTWIELFGNYSREDHDHSSDYAPISGSTNYAPASGSTNYAPATGSTVYASQTSVPSAYDIHNNGRYAPLTHGYVSTAAPSNGNTNSTVRYLLLTYTGSGVRNLTTLSGTATEGTFKYIKAGAANKILAVHGTGTNNMELVGGVSKFLDPVVPLLLRKTGTRWVEVSGPVVDVVTLAVGGPTDALATGDGQVVIPVARAGRLIKAKAFVATAPSAGTPTFQIRKGASTDLLSTRITIDATEKSSETAAAASVIKTDGDPTLAADDIISVDVDVAGTDTQGAVITLYIQVK